MAKEILLTQGKIAIVDDEDYDRLMQYKWCYSSTIGYAVSRERIDGVKHSLLMHRMVMNAPKELVTDHINMNKLDNRKVNLRLCTRSENNRNMSPTRLNNKSGYKGVYKPRDSEKWACNIRKDNVSRYLGVFESKHDAARMYNFWAIDMFGEFANLNIIEEGR